jgi:microcystin-dependent protein/WD40 repeat protein
MADTDPEKTIFGPTVRLKLDDIQHIDGDQQFLINDAGEHAHNARIKGAPRMVVDEVFGKALAFSGEDEAALVDTQNFASDDGSFSLAIWVKCTAQEHGANIVSGLATSTWWALRATNRFEFVWGQEDYDEQQSLVSPIPLQANTWTHVAITVEPGKMSMFLNGSLVTTGTEVPNLSKAGGCQVALGANQDIQNVLSALVYAHSMGPSNVLALHSHEDNLALGFQKPADPYVFYTFDAHTGLTMNEQSIPKASAINGSTYSREGQLVIWTDVGIATNDNPFGDDVYKFRDYEKDSKLNFGDFDYSSDLAKGVLSAAQGDEDYWALVADDGFHIVHSRYPNPEDDFFTAGDYLAVSFDPTQQCFCFAQKRAIKLYQWRRLAGQFTYMPIFYTSDHDDFQIDTQSDILYIATPLKPIMPKVGDNQVLAFCVALADGSVHSYGWDVGDIGCNNRVPRPILFHGEPVVFNLPPLVGLSLDDTGRHLLCAYSNYGDLYDPMTGKGTSAESKEIWTTHDTDVRAAVISPDARIMATAGTDDMLRIWDIGKLHDVPTPLDATLSGFRLYDRKIAQNEVEEAALADLPTVAVGTVFPIDFSLHNYSEQQALFNTSEAQDLFLELTNVGAHPVIFPSVGDLKTSDIPTVDRNVLELHFRPGTLKASTLTLNTVDDAAGKTAKTVDSTAAWTMQHDGDVIRLVHRGGDDPTGKAARTLPTNKSVKLKISGFIVNQALGSHSTRVQLSYRLHYGDGTPLMGSRLHYLRILNISDSDVASHIEDLRTKALQLPVLTGRADNMDDLIKAIQADLKIDADLSELNKDLNDIDYFAHGGPLEAGIVGVPQVLADGKSTSKLRLRIRKRDISVDVKGLALRPDIQACEITLYLKHPKLKGIGLVDDPETHKIGATVVFPHAWTADYPDNTGVVKIKNKTASKHPKYDTFDYIDIDLSFVTGSVILGDDEDLKNPKSGSAQLMISYEGIGLRKGDPAIRGWLHVPVERNRLIHSQNGVIAQGCISLMNESMIGFHDETTIGDMKEGQMDSVIHGGDQSLHLAGKGEIKIYPGVTPNNMDLTEASLTVRQGKDDMGNPVTRVADAHLDGIMTATGGFDATGAGITAAKATIHGDVKVDGDVRPGVLPNPTGVPENQLGSYLVPAGAIILWYGDAASVPDGWHICDGSNPGKIPDIIPNLQSRFVVGAGQAPGLEPYVAGVSGKGAERTTLTMDNMPRHDHGWAANPPDEGLGHEHIVLDLNNTRHNSDGDSWDVTTNTIDPGKEVMTDPRTTGIVWTEHIKFEGKSTAFENRPPYLALHYIMKL